MATTTTTDTQPATEQGEPEPAERPSQAAAWEASEWSARRVKLQERITAIGAEVDEAARAIAEARRRAVLGEDLDDAIASLEDLRHTRQAERTELEQRIAIALAEEAAATQRANAAFALERHEDEVAEAEQLVGATPAIDEALSAAVLAVRAALRERLAIARRANELATGGVRVDGLEAARSPVTRNDYLEGLPAFADPTDRVGISIAI